MTSTEPVWMTRQAHTRLQNELAALRSRPSIEVPDDFMDYDDNLVANYTSATSTYPPDSRPADQCRGR